MKTKSSTREKWGTVKDAVARLSEKNCALFFGIGKRHGYYDAAKRIGVRIKISQIGGRRSRSYQVRLAS